MPADKHSGADTDDNAVERSLEDFIARANSTLPAIDESTQPRAKLAEVKKRRRQKREEPAATLAVIGSEAPLAEVTEIVKRVPALGDGTAPPRRGPGWRLVLAFVAGAAAVLALTKLMTNGGRPQAPAPPAVVVAPVVTPVPVPRPVVEPIPATELPAPEVQPPPEPPRPVVHAKPRPKPVRAAPEAKVKSARGLVDPFAN